MGSGWCSAGRHEAACRVKVAASTGRRPPSSRSRPATAQRAVACRSRAGWRRQARRSGSPRAWPPGPRRGPCSDSPWEGLQPGDIPSRGIGGDAAHQAVPDLNQAAVRPQQLDIRAPVIVAVADPRRQQRRDEAIWSAPPDVELAGVGGHRDPVPAVDEQEGALPPGQGRDVGHRTLGQGCRPGSQLLVDELVSLAAGPVGEGVGDVEAGAGDAWVSGEPRLPQRVMTTANTTASAAAAAISARRLRRRAERPPGGSPGLMPATAVLPSGKEAVQGRKHSRSGLTAVSRRCGRRRRGMR